MRVGKSHTASYGGEESKLGGKNGKRRRDGGENGRGRYPVSNFFFFFSFGWLRFNHFHPMAEKKMEAWYRRRYCRIFLNFMYKV